MKTSADLIESVRTTITAPNNQTLLTEDRLLALANEEIDSKVVPMMCSLNQDYFVTMEEESMVADTAEYDIPYRSVGRTLRDLKVRDSANSVRDVVKVALEDAHLSSHQSLPLSFYFKGDQIVMVPTPIDTQWTLQKFYLLKPNSLVQLSKAGKVTAVSGNTLTLDNVPSAFVASATIDIIQGKQGNRLRAMDQSITNVSGSQITVATVPTGTVIGDYVGISCESPVIQLPDEIFPYLTFLTSKRCLEALGDYEGSNALEKEIQIRKKNCEYLLAPRIEGESTKILQRFGLLRGNRSRRTRGFF